MTTANPYSYGEALRLDAAATALLAPLHQPVKDLLTDNADKGRQIEAQLACLKNCAVTLRDCKDLLEKPEIWDDHARGVLLGIVKENLFLAEEFVSLTIEPDTTTEARLERQESF